MTRKRPHDVTRAGWPALQQLHATGGRLAGGRGRWGVLGRLLRNGYIVYEQVDRLSFRYKLTPKALAALGVEPPAPQPGAAADQPTETV